MLVYVLELLIDVQHIGQDSKCLQLDFVINEFYVMRNMKITFITGNQHKVKEAKGIFDKFGLKLEHVDLGYPEIQGELVDVAKYGAKHVAKRFGKPVIVEDAGIFIKSLKWFPGTYSSYIQDTLGNKGILKLMSDVEDRYAEFSQRQKVDAQGRGSSRTKPLQPYRVANGPEEIPNGCRRR